MMVQKGISYSDEASDSDCYAPVNAPSSSLSSAEIGAIIGGSIGGFIFLICCCIVIACVCCYCSATSAQKKQTSAVATSTTYSQVSASTNATNNTPMETTGGQTATEMQEIVDAPPNAPTRTDEPPNYQKVEQEEGEGTKGGDTYE